MKTEEKSLLISSSSVADKMALDAELKDGWRVKQMCAFNQASVMYASILVILEREIK